MSTTTYKCTPRQIKNFVYDCVEVGLVPFVQSSPGLGKSDIMRGISEENNLYLIDHRLSTSAPEDLSGLPDMSGDKAVFKPFDIFPIVGDELPKGKDGWMLFFDELNSATKMVQAAGYKTILDKYVGQKKLHQKVIITAAGNLATDRAIVNSLSTAMQSRLVHLEMEFSHKEFMEDVVYKREWDWRIAAYLNYKPDEANDFRPDHNEKTFCCPRTWEFMNRLCKGKEISTAKAPLYAGTITSGIAATFVTFVELISEMPTFKQIMSDPMGTPIPHQTPIQFATTTHLIEYVDDKTFENIAKYIARFSSTFQIVFYRSLLVRKPDLRRHPQFIDAMVSLNRYFHD